MHFTETEKNSNFIRKHTQKKLPETILNNKIVEIITIPNFKLYCRGIVIKQHGTDIKTD